MGAKYFFAGMLTGSLIVFGVDYLFDSNKEITYIKYPEKSVDGLIMKESYILEKGLGKFRNRTIYHPNIEEEYLKKDTTINTSH